MRKMAAFAAIALILSFSPKSASAAMYAVCHPSWVNTGSGDQFSGWGCNYYASDDGGGGGGKGDGPGGGGGGGGGLTREQRCAELVQNKPPNCPNPIGFPTGAEYGKGTYAAGSGLAKAIALKNSGEMLPGSIGIFEFQLAKHTTDLSKMTMSQQVVDDNLKEGLRYACAYQEMYALPGAYGTSKCATTLARLHQEAGWGGWFYTFKDWLETNDVDIGVGVLSLQGLVSTQAPDNSLSAKAKKVEAQVKCSTWWVNVQKNQCGVQ